MKFTSSLTSFSENKLNHNLLNLCIQSILAGIFIAIGGCAYILILNTQNNTPTKLLASMSFSIGLILIFKFKSQLFTGNNLLTFSLLTKNIKFKRVVFNWVIVFIGNFIGALIISLIMSVMIYKLDNTALYELFFKVAYKKVNSPWSLLLTKAIACNLLVCIAVSLGIYYKKGFKFYLGIIAPITAFVFCGFEHCIANMFFLSTDIILSLIATKSLLLSQLDLFLFHNLLYVTLGNLIGGVLLSISYYLLINKTQANG